VLKQVSNRQASHHGGSHHQSHNFSVRVFPHRHVNFISQTCLGEQNIPGSFTVRCLDVVSEFRKNDPVHQDTSIALVRRINSRHRGSPKITLVTGGKDENPRLFLETRLSAVTDILRSSLTSARSCA